MVWENHVQLTRSEPFRCTAVGCDEDTVGLIQQLAHGLRRCMDRWRRRAFASSGTLARILAQDERSSHGLTTCFLATESTLGLDLGHQFSYPPTVLLGSQISPARQR